MGKSWNFVKYCDETTSSQKTSCQTHTLVSQKTSCQTHTLVCLTASFLTTGGLIFSKCMHGLQACLFKYITVSAIRIMLSVVKMPLKGEAGGHALIVMEITLLIIEKSWNCVFEFLWESCIIYYCYPPD